MWQCVRVCVHKHFGDSLEVLEYHTRRHHTSQQAPSNRLRTRHLRHTFRVIGNAIVAACTHNYHVQFDHPVSCELICTATNTPNNHSNNLLRSPAHSQNNASHIHPALSFIQPSLNNKHNNTRKSETV